MKRPLLILTVCVLGIAAAILWVRAIQFTAPYQERKFAAAALPTLERDALRYQDNPVFLYHLGRQLNRAERYAEAVPVLERAAGLNPDDARIRSEWADALVATGRVTGAFGQLNDYLRAHPNEAQAHLMMGQFYGAQNSMKRALGELEKCVALDARQAQAWKLISVSAAQLYQPARRIEAARRAVALTPNDAEARHLLGAALGAKDRAEAVINLREAVRLAPENVLFACELGKILLESPDSAERSEAEKALRSAAERQPDNADANRLLGQALLLRGEANGAKRFLERALAEEPGTAMTSKLLSDVYRAQGETDAAAAWLRKYQDLHTAELRLEGERRKLYMRLTNAPNDPNANRRMAQLLAQQGRAEEVLQHHALAERCALDSPRALVPAANDLAAAGFSREALNLARLARQHSQSNPAAYEAMGNALTSMGRIREASVQYAIAGSWHPEKIPAYRKKLEEGVAQRAANASPSDRLVQQALREERAELGPGHTSDSVVEKVKRAVALEPENTNALWHLFRIRVARRERDEALEAGRRLLTLSPEDTAAQIKMAVLLLGGDKVGGEAATGSDDEITRCIKAAEPDKSLAPTLHYARGLLARRQKKWPEAVRELREAVRLDPSADLAFLQLAQAERAAGNVREAEIASTEYRNRQQTRQEEGELLSKIVKNPDKAEFYRQASAYYRKRNRPGEALAIEQELRRRAAVSSAKSIPPTKENP